MIFEWMSDPSAWVGLLTLVVLEIVLGIDNLVFIAILAEKLPPEQRNTARVVGLILALLMRLVLLASIAWVVTLTEPLFHIFDHPFSGRDLILLFGGVFLLFKGTMELHERIDAKVVQKEESPANAVFWMVIVQIVVLDDPHGFFRAGAVRSKVEHPLVALHNLPRAVHVARFDVGRVDGDAVFTGASRQVRHVGPATPVGHRRIGTRHEAL